MQEAKDEEVWSHYLRGLAYQLLVRPGSFVPLYRSCGDRIGQGR